ncbi:MAG: ABC transporter ATP-binding protein [Gammaproteobacteria bacterium]|nr:ABC transporter ATP-binding protein [Gammaproteobacteria bacterium]
MLTIQNMHKAFGGIRAVNDASFAVAEGSITGLIGPNGAGKTTLFNLVAGALRPDAGRVTFDGADITGEPAHRLFHKNLLRTFQIPHEFDTMTAQDNLMMVPGDQAGERLFNTWFRWRRVERQEARVRERAEQVLEFLGLSHVADSRAGNLSGGQKKLLEIGRTMMVDAKLVLLDEVGAGVNRTLLGEIAGKIEQLNKEHGYTFCLIEHDMDLINRLCDRVVVMAEGTVLTTGSAAEVQADERVIEAYLGRSDTSGRRRRPPRR